MNHVKFSALRLITIAFFLVTLASCEKEVHINLATSPTQLVVQGGVETDIPPYVFLTSTIGFFSTVDLTTLQNSFVHNADIKVSDGSKTITLKEYSFDTGTGNKFYIYSIDTSDPAAFMVGEVEKTYSLSITYAGQTYTAVTKIPAPKGVDTMWFDVPIFKNSRTPDSAWQLYVNYRDPDSTGNCVRYYTRINSGQFWAVDQFNDQVVNGKLITAVPLYAGYEHVQNAKQDSLRYFYPGDTVTLKWSVIDQGVYDFWNSFAYAGNAMGNPFASPINLKTNMTNGALGIWAGYGSLYTTAIVPH